MNHLDSNGSPTAEKVTPASDDVVAVLEFRSGGESTVIFKRYRNGDLLLRQGDDLVHLTVAQFAQLKAFAELLK